MDVLMAAVRDASWHPCSNGRGNGAYATHVCRPSDPALAACSTFTAVQSDHASPAADVPLDERCKRGGCRVLYQRADLERRA